MKHNISVWQITGFGLVSLLGTFLHFAYDLSGKSVLVAPFSGINESTWEHMKLLYFPLLIFALIQFRYFYEYKNYWCVKLKGFLLGLILIPVLFYTYNGCFGKSPDWINISIFFISTAAAFLLEYKLFNKNYKCKHPFLSLFIIIFIGILFVIFTFNPPNLPLFKNPF